MHLRRDFNTKPGGYENYAFPPVSPGDRSHQQALSSTPSGGGASSSGGDTSGRGLPLICMAGMPRWTTTTCSIRRRPFERLVGDLLERHDLAAAVAAVSRGRSSFACWSLMRSRSDSALKPPNTTLWTAPILAQASIAIASSGTACRRRGRPCAAPSDVTPKLRDRDCSRSAFDDCRASLRRSPPCCGVRPERAGRCS